MELSIGRDLEIGPLLEPTMTNFDVSHAVVGLPHGLLDIGYLGVRPKSSQLKRVLGLIEEMEDVVKPRDWGEVDTVWTQVLA